MQCLGVEGYFLVMVRSFTYLVAELNNENKVVTDINKRIMAGDRAYLANVELFLSSILPRKTKTQMISGLIKIDCNIFMGPL